MPLYKKQPFPLAEKPNDLMPNELVFQVHVTNELFRDYSEYLKRINLYRRRVWTSKASRKTNMTYEEALVSEKKAAEKVKQFPKEFVAPVLREVQFSLLPLRDLVNAIFEKLQGPLSEGTEMYARKNNHVYPCKIVKVLEGDDSTEYKVLWLGKDKKVIGNSLIKGEDLIEKLPFSKEDLKYFIRESTYCYSPWVLHDNLAKSHGISLSTSIQNGLVVCSRKRKKAEDEKTLPGQSQTTTEVVCRRKRGKAEDEKTPGQSLFFTEDNVHAPDILIKKMPTLKRCHEDANNSHVKASKDIHQPKKLRVKAAEKSSYEQKEPLEDPIAGKISQRRFVPVKQTGNFSKLPYELRVEIAKRLKLLEDFTCFRSVSRSLHLYVEEKYFEGLRFRKSLPYLMLPPVSSSDGNDDDDVLRQFYSLIEGESIVACLKFPVIKTSTKMYFESLGWLLTVEVDGSMSLVDPFSDTEIPVPHLHTLPILEHVYVNVDKRILIRRMVLTSRPNENSDFILMVIFGGSPRLAFWRLGDKAWNNIDDEKCIFRDVVYGGDGQFYAINARGVIYVINLAAGHVECRVIADCDDVLSVTLSRNLYILKAINGSVLVIKRIKEYKYYLTNEFQVYDIDIETGKLTQIYSLGSMAVFLGRNSSFAVDATAPPFGGVIKANHIYFTDDFAGYQDIYFNSSRFKWMSSTGGSLDAKGGGVDSGVFNFQTGDIEPVYPVEPLLTNVSPAIWITPNLCF